MKRNCNLHLHMLPSNIALSSSMSILSDHLGSCSDHNQIKILNSDATELQAIDILKVARQETKKSKNTNSGSPLLQLQVHGNKGLSLKRSLQKFLERRKSRIQASMPY